jgi:hypothetical protein
MTQWTVWRLMRVAAVGLVVVAVLTYAWRERQTWQQWLQVSTPAAAPIVFDPLPVDAPAGSLAPARPASSATANAPGVMKKCVLPDGVLYTDKPCPSHAKVAAVQGKPVNVLPVAPSAKAAQGGADAPRALRGALGLQDGDNLRQKMIDQAASR